MKKIYILSAILLLTLSGARGASAQSGEHSGHGGMSTPAPGGSHEGMQMGGGMIMLDTVTVEGIQAMAHLQDLRKGTSPGTSDATHTFMVGFEDAGKGTAITQGRAAVKVTDPSGQTGSAITLDPKEGFFKADLALKKPGRYIFEVGSKLNDDKVRQFRFTYDMK